MDGRMVVVVRGSTQKSAAEAFGSGSVPASALRVNMNRYSSAEGG